MTNPEKHAAALISIYDAANDSDAWNLSLDACVDYVQAHSANIMFHENDRHSRWRYALGSQRWRACSPEQMEKTIQFFEKYDSQAWKYVHSHRKQTLLLDTDFWTDSNTLVNREDYEFFRSELGFERKAGCRLNDNLCWTDNIAFQFPIAQQQVPQENLQRIKHLLPHAAKSIELWRTFSILKSQYQAVLAALDHVSIGLCVVAPGGSVIVANEAAQNILSLGSDIRLGQDKQLHCRSSEIHRSLRHAIEQSCATATGTASVAEAFQLVGNDGAPQISIEISPLRDSGAEIATHFTGALVTLIDLSADLSIDCGRIASAYKLTATEQQVCQLLTTGLSVADIADSRNVTPDTIKSQLKSIYRKTRCHSRVELIRLALKANPPVK